MFVGFWSAGTCFRTPKNMTGDVRPLLRYYTVFNNPGYAVFPLSGGASEKSLPGMDAAEAKLIADLDHLAIVHVNLDEFG